MKGEGEGEGKECTRSVRTDPLHCSERERERNRKEGIGFYYLYIITNTQLKADPPTSVDSREPNWLTCIRRKAAR